MVAPSLIKRIYDLHVDWLDAKGYTEAGIDADDAPGTFQKQLRDKFQSVINDAMWSDLTGWMFVTSIIGRFKQEESKEKDSVTFVFLYKYDPTVKLELTAVQAQFKQNVRTFRIEREMDLLPPDVIYQELKYGKNRKLANKMESSTAKGNQAKGKIVRL